MEEIWKYIDDLNGYYQISNFGNVRSLSRTIHDSIGRTRVIKGKQISLNENKETGYIEFSSYVENKRKTLTVHRCMAIAFIPNHECKTDVNHKNGIKSDNRIENLEWATKSENSKHAFMIGLNVSPLKGRFGSMHPGSKPVNQLDMSSSFINTFASATKASRKTGIDRKSICSACLGK